MKTAQKTNLVLWGKARGGAVWIKLSENASLAEIKRREKEGWQCVRLAKVETP